MKKLLVLLLLSININANSQTTYIADQNFEQELINLGYDSVLDNSVQTSSIENISFLDIQNKGITDLTGLEDFQNLTSFICSNNQISSILFNPNVNLNLFIFNDNNINQIDLSQHTNLEELGGTNNELTSLDLSNNQNLQYLYVSGNVNLNQLNVSQLTGLQHLLCSNTGLITLDLSQNTVLNTLYLDNSNINNLDLSNNNSLNTLFLSNSNFSSIDLRNNANQNLIYFDFKYNPNLDYILVDNCSYSNNNWQEEKDLHTDYIENLGEECESLDLDEFEKNSDIILYPLPATDVLYFQHKNNIEVENVVLMDLKGTIVKKIKKANNIDVSNLPKGFYLIKIVSNKKIDVKKIIIK